MAQNENGQGQGHGEGQGHHHILSESMAKKIFGALVVFTIVTVAAARVDLGVLNFPLAMLIASIKAALVVFFFMGLYYDSNENRVIFFGSFIFVTIFLVLSSADIFFRGDVYVKGPIVMEQKGKARFSQPWVATPEIRAFGKEQFDIQCATCHGMQGKGDGPASAGLNPKPRNFTSGDGWKNGRKPSQVFGTLTKGLNTMPSFSSMPGETRWALAHYVLSLGPTPPQDSAADLKVVGIDPSKGDSSGGEEKAIPVDLAIELIAVDGKK